MAEIVGAIATTHTPVLLGWFDDAPEDQQRAALNAFTRMRDHIEKVQPDVMIIFANDHLINWPINNTPEYTFGIDDVHVGPADWYDSWLSQDEKYRVPGHSMLARYIVNETSKHGLAFSYLRNMQFDDGMSVPTRYLNPDCKIPFIPIAMNCTVPLIPTPKRAYQVGIILHEVLSSYPGSERILLVGSGGLSHEPGGPRYFYIDDEFDQWFLDLMVEGDHDKILRECTLERMEEAGSGGTGELIAWILVMAMTRGPAEVLDYVKTYAWRCSSGWVIWHDVING